MTIKDIARLSGCAVSTVSRALNDHPDVNAETRERICRIVKENNYCPNRNAKLLKQTSGKTVLLIVKGSANLFFTPILEQIQSSAGKKGISVTVSYISENDNEVSERNGEWRQGPSFELFSEIITRTGKGNIIAEDLGIVTPAVRRL